jgi:hypothetical protein
MANDDLGKIVYVGVDGRELDAFGEGSGGYSTGTHPAGGDFPNGACDVAVDAAGYTVVNSCQDPSSPTHDTELLDASHQLVGAWHGSPFALSPRFGPNGEVYALSHGGEILKLSITLPQG